MSLGKSENKSTVTSMNAAVGADCQKQDDADLQNKPTVPLEDFLQLAELTDRCEHQRSKRLRRCTQGGSGSLINVEATVKQVAEIVSILTGLGLVRAGSPPTGMERRLRAEAYGRLAFLLQDIAPTSLTPLPSVERLIEELGLRLPQELGIKVTTPTVLGSSPSSLQVDHTRAVVDTISGGKCATYVELSQPQQFNSSLHSQVLLFPGPPGSNVAVPRIMMPATKDETEESQDTFSRIQIQEGHDAHLEGQVSPSSSVTTTTTTLAGQDSLASGAKQKQADAMSARSTHKHLTLAIQNLIHSRPSECDLRAAHPKPFMSAPLPCGMCKAVVRDTGSVLTCDSCEKVFHLRCLQSYLLKGIPKGDWYCPKCAANTQGQHQDPKYGRVKEGFSFSSSSGIVTGAFPVAGRSPAWATPSKGTADPQGLLMKSAEGHSGKKLAVDRDFGDTSTGEAETGAAAALSNPAVGGGSARLDAPSAGSFTALLDSFTQAESKRLSSPSGVEIEITPVQALKKASFSSQIRANEKFSGSKLQPGQQPTIEFQNPQSQFNEIVDAGKVADLKDDNIQADTSGSFDLLKTGVEVGASGNFQTSRSAKQLCKVPRALELEAGKDTESFGVQWVGDVAQRQGGKNFYTACSVGGFIHRLHDCALFRPEAPNVPPYIARLQALWEDTTSGQKWVRVNWCYYPADMMRIAGRPESPETHEVYESNHGDNNLVETIQGPCLVLRPECYSKEIQRRREVLRSGDGGEGLIPIFMCRWLYDVPRATFRLATEDPSTSTLVQ